MIGRVMDQYTTGNNWDAVLFNDYAEVPTGRARRYRARAHMRRVIIGHA